MNKEVVDAFENLRNVCLKQVEGDKEATQAMKSAFIIAKDFYENLTWFLRK